jgi:hypothetical protein
LSDSTSPAELAHTAQPAVLARLDDQITWYERNSQTNKRAYKCLRGWTVFVAAAVPLIAAFGVKDPRVAASLAATIALVEGLQHLNQYHSNWLLFRSTCEALKHEKFLYLSSVGTYAAPNGNVQLAEKIEGIVAQESAKWMSLCDDQKPNS